MCGPLSRRPGRTPVVVATWPGSTWSASRIGSNGSTKPPSTATSGRAVPGSEAEQDRDEQHSRDAEGKEAQEFPDEPVRGVRERTDQGEETEDDGHAALEIRPRAVRRSVH